MENTLLKHFRELAGLSEKDLANRIGLNANEYYDLESEDELIGTIPLSCMFKLCQVLNVYPHDLLSSGVRSESAKSKSFTFEGLTARIRHSIAEMKLSVEEFSERAGWDISAVFSSPAEILEWDVDCLRDVSEFVKFDWLKCLDQEFANSRDSQDITGE